MGHAKARTPRRENSQACKPYKTYNKKHYHQTNNACSSTQDPQHLIPEDDEQSDTGPAPKPMLDPQSSDPTKQH